MWFFCLDELETSHDESVPFSSQPMQEGQSADGQRTVGQSDGEVGSGHQS